MIEALQKQLQASGVLGGSHRDLACATAEDTVSQQLPPKRLRTESGAALLVQLAGEQVNREVLQQDGGLAGYFGLYFALQEY